MGAHSTKSRAITSSLDKTLAPEWQEHSNKIHLTKGLKSFEKKVSTDFETFDEKKKSKANQHDNTLRPRNGTDMLERNHQSSDNFATLRSTIMKPSYISNPMKLCEKSAEARKSSKVYICLVLNFR